MTEFVIVIAASLAMAVAPPSADPRASVPANAPTVGFRTYPDLRSCEEAIATMVVPSTARLVCLPVETLGEDMASTQ
jgi:hypothetical protein